MSHPIACTIVANNYLAYARVLTRSFLERHPDGELFVLLVDRPDPAIRYADEPFTALFVEDLGIPAFPHYAFRYSILELNTAVKPFFLLHLHRTTGCDRLCYFDPDILVTGDLGGIYDLLGEADAVLTPHITAPLEDGRIPGERDFLLSGIYNLGFLGIAFNERTLPFLDWWHRRLYRECLHAVERGLFVDQRWMDFAPAFLARAAVYRDEGCNTAYWNLAHRTLTPDGAGWRVNGTPLRFFHFSGYSLDRPEQIPRYQNRFALSGRPDLQPLFDRYGERLRAEGHPGLVGLPYSFGSFDDGTPIPDVAREALRLIDPTGLRWPDPVRTAGPDSFVGWLEQGDDSRSAIFLPRLALFLWERRPDLQQAFPNPERGDRPGFAEWFAERDEKEKIGPRFTRPVAESLRRQGSTPARHVRLGAARVAERMAAGEELVGSLTPDEVAWLSTDAAYDPGRRPRIPRLAMMLHRYRADLQGAYPDPLGVDRVRFALWYVTDGRAEYGLPGALIAPVLRTLPLRENAWARLWWERRRLRQGRKRRASAAPTASTTAATPPADAPAPGAGAAGGPGPGAGGLNVIGWATAPTGVGEACRSTLRALAEAGVPYALWNLGASAADAAAAAGGQGLPFEISLYHVNADMMEVISRQLPRALTRGHYRVALWFWELSHFPLTFTRAFRHVDAVWAPSRFCEEAFRALSPVPVRWMPPAVIAPTAPPADRGALGIDANVFLFFFAFDALSIPDRKNPVGLLTAFATAVRASRRPLHLLLKINHLEAEPELEDRIQELAAGLPVTVVTRPMSRTEVDSLTAACDAYVSLHRSEGLGLPLIEALYLGKPVISTGYGGCTDFLDETTGWVVPHTLTALEEPRGPYPAGAVWAEPDLEGAAAHMVAVAADPQAAAARAAAGRCRVTQIYAPAAAGARFRDELEKIRFR
jgi:glycosyltransferase involved in cell wall biosynthesis